MMTKQEVFDTVYHHLLTQKQKSVDDDGVCLYRGPHGTKCAAGVLIKDELYKHVFEGESAANVGVRAALADSGVDPDDINLVVHLQEMHDEYYPDEWPEELASIASLYGLRVPA